MQTVRRVFEARAAKAAMELFAQGSKGLKALSEQPSLQAILLQMHRTRNELLEIGHIYAAMENAEPVEPEEEDES